MLQQIILDNPWWDSGSVPEALAPPVKRDKFTTLLNRLEDSRIVALIGPRRVGKSTLIYQMIDHLLKKVDIPSKRICFLSLENPLLKFDEALEVYLTEILNETLRDLKERIYLFLDEVYFWPEWNRRLKRLVDLKLPLKIIVSGSSATHITKGSIETLAGRILEEYIYPLDFGEFIKFTDASFYQKLSFLKEIDLLSSRGMEDYSSLRSETSLHSDRLYTFFQTFRKKGGFIPYLNLEFPDYHRLVRSDIIEKTIYKDLSIIYNLRSPRSLETILIHLSLHSGELLNFQNLSQEYGISLPSLEKLIYYLEQTHFAQTVKNILPSGRPALRSYVKAYVADLSIKRALVRGIEDEGLEVETIVFNNLYRKAVANGWSIYYWNYQKSEVDIVLKTEAGCMPIEVKFRKDIKPAEIRNLLKFMDLFKLNAGYVFTKDTYKVENIDGKKIVYLPVYLLW